jgi:hypothetical protein
MEISRWARSCIARFNAMLACAIRVSKKEHASDTSSGPTVLPIGFFSVLRTISVVPKTYCNFFILVLEIASLCIIFK